MAVESPMKKPGAGPGAAGTPTVAQHKQQVDEYKDHLQSLKDQLVALLATKVMLAILTITGILFYTGL